MQVMLKNIYLKENLMEHNRSITNSLTPEFVQFYNKALEAYREHCAKRGLVPKHSLPNVFSVSLTFDLGDDDECFAVVSFNQGHLSVDLRDRVYGVKPHQKISTDCPPNSHPRRRR
jgi:hypothetical protein